MPELWQVISLFVAPALPPIYKWLHDQYVLLVGRTNTRLTRRGNPGHTGRKGNRPGQGARMKVSNVGKKKERPTLPGTTIHLVDRDYQVLPAAKIRKVCELAKALKGMVRKQRDNAWDIGKALLEIRRTGLYNRSFVRFLNEYVCLSTSSAYNYMDVAQAFPRKDDIPAGVSFSRDLYQQARLKLRGKKEATELSRFEEVDKTIKGLKQLYGWLGKTESGLKTAVAEVELVYVEELYSQLLVTQSCVQSYLDTLKKAAPRIIVKIEHEDKLAELGWAGSDDPKEKYERMLAEQNGQKANGVVQPSTNGTSSGTPIERRGPYWVKRDDLFQYAGVCGGKVRTCLRLARQAKKGQGLVTAGVRQSPQVQIVATIAKALGLPCRAHVPGGDLTPELKSAKACGAELVPQRPGYNSVIIKRARDDAQARGWVYIPFGMEDDEAVKQTAEQVRDIPADVKRIVVPVGSGMSLAGVLAGLDEIKSKLPVLGVQVGADPYKRLHKYAPHAWINRCKLESSKQKYHDPAPVTDLHGVELDPIYEAKCLPFLKPGDLLWVVGIRGSGLPKSKANGRAALALPAKPEPLDDFADVPF